MVHGRVLQREHDDVVFRGGDERPIFGHRREQRCGLQLEEGKVPRVVDGWQLQTHVGEESGEGIRRGRGDAVV